MRYNACLSLWVSLLLFVLPSLHGQDARVAKYFYQNGEYEKAAMIYEQLYEQDPRNKYTLELLVQTLIEIPDIPRATKLIDKQISADPSAPALYVMKALINEAENDFEGADKFYKKAIENIKNDPNSATGLARSFAAKSRFDLAIATLETAEKMIDRPGVFDLQLANYYQADDQKEKMINRYLNTIMLTPDRLSLLQNTFSRNFDDEDFSYLVKQIIAIIQEEPNNAALNELLTWTYLQNKKYKLALRHEIALDRRTGTSGKSIYELGQTCLNSNELGVADQAFTYLIENKDKTSPFYRLARQGELQMLEKSYKSDNTIDTAMVNRAADRFEAYFTEFGYDSESGNELIDWATLVAFYQKQPSRAIEILESALDQTNLNKYVKGRMKLLLGDIYLISDDRWESTLLYSQVDKDFKEGYLGEIARFKNANLSYYFGDFEWAQTQYKILKTTSSKLIANDAIDKSVFITDNLGLDTTDLYLSQFAEAEFLVFKKDFKEANEKFKSLLSELSDHNLIDDIYFQLALVAKEQKNYDLAISYFEKIIAEHAEEIKMDNSLFELGTLYETTLNQPEKAMTYYERIFTDFSNSTFAVDARKRYRALRGDEVN